MTPERNIKQIEEWSSTTFKEVVFDSDIDDWSKDTSTFDQKIFNREKLTFIMEDTEGNVFGGFVNAKIDKYVYCEYGEWKGSKITDKNAFVFSLRSNGRLKEPMKFDFKSENRDWAFQLQKSIDDYLFVFGGGNDIRINKENSKSECYCNEESFDYQGKKKVLVGKEKWCRYTVQRIQVWQMYETDEQKRKREEREKQEEIEQQKKYDEETMKLSNQNERNINGNDGRTKK